MILDGKQSAKAAGGAVAFIACCMAFISPHEGIKHVAYADGGGVWTICRGHTFHVKQGDTADDNQCQIWFEQDTKIAVDAVDLLTEGHHIPDATKKVFVDQVFNAGTSAFAKSTMLKKIKADDLDGACHEFSRWRFIGNKDCAIRSNNCYGLVVRRAEQEAECLKGMQ